MAIKLVQEALSRAYSDYKSAIDLEKQYYKDENYSHMIRKQANIRFATVNEYKSRILFLDCYEIDSRLSEEAQDIALNSIIEKEFNEFCNEQNLLEDTKDDFKDVFDNGRKVKKDSAKEKAALEKENNELDPTLERLNGGNRVRAREGAESSLDPSKFKKPGRVNLSIVIPGKG